LFPSGKTSSSHAGRSIRARPTSRHTPIGDQRRGLPRRGNRKGCSSRKMRKATLPAVLSPACHRSRLRYRRCRTTVAGESLVRRETVNLSHLVVDRRGEDLADAWNRLQQDHGFLRKTAAETCSSNAAISASRLEMRCSMATPEWWLPSREKRQPPVEADQDRRAAGPPVASAAAGVRSAQTAASTRSAPARRREREGGPGRSRYGAQKRTRWSTVSGGILGRERLPSVEASVQESGIRPCEAEISR